jgi:hypothetical protein
MGWAANDQVFEDRGGGRDGWVVLPCILLIIPIIF